MQGNIKKTIKRILIGLNLYRRIIHFKKWFTFPFSHYINKFQIIIVDKFIDNEGNEFPILKGLRDFITPSWKNMYEFKTFTALDLSRLEIHDYLENANKNIVEMERVISLFNISIKNKVVLDIGCYAGGALCKLLDKSPQKVIGIDISSYYINQTKNATVTDETINLAQNKLTELREKVSFYDLKSQANNISFFEDNIVNSKLPDSTFDLILSWEVLEHIVEPRSAIAEMNRLLKTGGYMYHHYNPFFSINGGHSLCTLDFQWGHCCLNIEEFDNYIKKFRFEEHDVAANFFINSLNRMTTIDLFKYLNEFNFKILNVEFFTEPSLKKFYSFDVFNKISKLYPSVMVNDLFQTAISFVAQKI